LSKQVNRPDLYHSTPSAWNPSLLVGAEPLNLLVLWFFIFCTFLWLYNC